MITYYIYFNIKLFQIKKRRQLSVTQISLLPLVFAQFFYCVFLCIYLLIKFPFRAFNIHSTNIAFYFLVLSHSTLTHIPCLSRSLLCVCVQLHPNCNVGHKGEQMKKHFCIHNTHHMRRDVNGMWCGFVWCGGISYNKKAPPPTPKYTWMDRQWQQTLKNNTQYSTNFLATSDSEIFRLIGNKASTCFYL